jgi:hypothetical protein
LLLQYFYKFLWLVEILCFFHGGLFVLHELKLFPPPPPPILISQY